MAKKATMVADPLHDRITSSRRSLIVEILGPAGSGKTTLFQALGQGETGMQTEFLPPVRDLEYGPFFGKYILQLVPTLMRLRGKGDRSLNRQELAWMAMLLGWSQILRKKSESGNKVILLEQGPIFLMALLSDFGPRSLRNSNVQDYWEKIIGLWSQTIDVVVCLDAPDEILIKRIRTRRDEHEVKDKTDQEIKEYLAKFRIVFERWVNILKMNNPELRVYRLNTGKNSVDDLMRSVIEFTNERADINTYEPV